MARIFRNIFVPDRDIAPYLDSDSPELPFVTRVIETREELERVAHLRLKAYRVPDDDDPKTIRGAIDQNDYAPNALVFGAFDKSDNSLIGSMRVVFGSRGPTTMLELTKLPGIWGREAHGEARLLCVPKHKHSRMVLLMLCKAYFLSCLNENIRYMVVGARMSMEPFYRLLCFDDLSTPPVFFLPPGHARKHRVLGLDLKTSESQWIAAHEDDSLRRIFFSQKHRDVRVPDAKPATNPLSALVGLEGDGFGEVQRIVNLVRGDVSRQA